MKKGLIDYGKNDKIVLIALSNLFTVSKKEGVVRFEDFYPKNKSHMALLSIAKIARDVFGYEIEVKMPIWRFLKFRFKYFKQTYGLGLARKDSIGINIQDFLDNISIPNELSEFFWETLYDNYYSWS